MLFDAIGVDATGRLLEARGGWQIYIPQTPRGGRWLREQLSDAQIGRLREAFGSGNVVLPTAAAVRRMVRDQEIRRMRKDGHSPGRIAHAHGMSARRIRQILRAGADPGAGPESGRSA